MPADLDAAAAQLREAYTRGPISPLRAALEPSDAKGAYAIQEINTRYWIAEGRRVIGRKIGLTAKAVQSQFGVDQPDYGTLFNTMEIEDGGEMTPSQVLQPRAEAEIAIVLGRDIHNVSATVQDVLSITAYAQPAIEIVGSRIADWKITFADTVADNASSGLFVRGKEPRSMAGLDLRTCGMVLELNGEVVSLGVGAACLGHPLNAAAWLVRKMSEVGETLKAGDVLMTGALGPMVAIKPGDVVRATIGGLGTCGFAFRGDRK